ncbi:hypothetical protein MTO96_033875, partial [Rhipicephalus appendiculatus]
KHFYDYTMVFWSPTEHCAVFTFLLNGKPVARTRPTLQDLKEVVTTTQKIWVRWMSYEQHTHTYIHKCIYDEFRPYNHSYLILQHYEVGGTW